MTETRPRGGDLAAAMAVLTAASAARAHERRPAEHIVPLMTLSAWALSSLMAAAPLSLEAWV